MTHEIVERSTGEIIPYSPSEDFEILDIYGEEAAAPAPRRLDWIATVSAGRRVQRGDKWIPEVSRDGTIYVSGDLAQCQGLVDALAANGGKRLTVAFPSDELSDFIVQRFARRTATALEVYGDAQGLTEIRDGVHTTYQPGSREFNALRKTCKVETHVLFCLAKWVGTRSVCIFPDGATGRYSIRFTSRNSLRNLVGKLEEIKRAITRGRLAGIPFELFLTYRDVPAPDGKSRNVPIWTIEFKPPQTIELTTGNLGELLTHALEEGERLRLLPAPQYSIEDALSEEPDVDLDMGAEQALEIMNNGDPPCDVRHWEAQWFAAVKDSQYDTDEMRGAFLAHHTGGAFDSLSAFLAQATEGQASGLIAAICDLIDQETQAARRARMGGALGEMRKLQSTMDGDDAQQRLAERTARQESHETNTPKVRVVVDPGWVHIDRTLDGNPVIEDEDEPSEPELPLTTPTEKPAKSRQRITLEANYAQLMTAAERLDIDLAPYQTDADTSDPELTALLGKLAAAIRTKSEKAEAARAS